VGDVGDGLLTLFLCGDVMTGRGVDQVLLHPGDPELRERHAGDARAYVQLAERVSGPIPRPAGFSWLWGEALPVLDDLAPDVRVINLETSITRSRRFAPGKAIHYRMSPGNIPCVAAARPDACALANNHVLDFGRRGLEDNPARPLRCRAAGGRRWARRCCGPAAGSRPSARWRARGHLLVRGGLWRDPVRLGRCTGPARHRRPADLSGATADDVAARARAAKRPGDVVVVSIHWGSNWGYQVDPDQVRFARRLIDGGVDIVHGHSSHHPRPVEVFRGKLVLYGCGDCIDDYEGITGHERYRADLRLLYFASLQPGTGTLAALRMAPMRARRMRLHWAPAADAQWLRRALERASRRFGSRVDLQPDGLLALRPGAS
jgi:poly-gamma-glutamate capsule biosynthesis protein CapA/YwtB (metallophosphatase superfamily)